VKFNYLVYCTEKL